VSLVRQALAKAEREAAARTAREKGLPESLSTAGQPYRAPRRPTRVPAALALVAALAAAGGVGYWVSRRASAPTPPPPVATAPAPAAPPASAASAAASPSTPPPVEAVAPRAKATTAVEPGAAPANPTTAPRPPVGATPATAEERAVRELPLAGGATLRLGGIAWSEVAPLAYLNGRLVGVGESVEGYRVARIEREQVLLERGGRRIVLLLHAAP
jgi:pilus assembly protein FimV